MYTIILTFQCSDTGNRKDTWPVETLLQLSPKITLWVTQPNLKSSHKRPAEEKMVKTENWLWYFNRYHSSTYGLQTIPCIDAEVGNSNASSIVKKQAC